MPQENIFFLPIKDVCQRDVIRCRPETSLVEAAATMSRHNITSILVSEKDAPVGIVTDRDLRNKVVARGIDPGTLSVRDVMNSPLIMVREDEFVFEALYRMSRYRIHRVVVVDDEDKLCGIISNSDILRLQTRSPQQMLYEIEEAEDIDDLRRLHQQVQGLVIHLLGTGVRTADMVRLISHLNDRILSRHINLLRAARYQDLPDNFAFVVLGSEGRGEQTLTTDQDNAIIYSDKLSKDEIARIKEFSEGLIDGLISIGVPPCLGGIMAKNDFWRRSLGSWKNIIDSWLSDSSPQNILNGSMFFDLRTLHGDATLEVALKEHIALYLSKNASFLARTAKNVLRFRTPIGFFGGFKLEKQGPHRGEMDIKKAGIFAITEGIKVLALESGKLDGGTRERLQALTRKGVLGKDLSEDLVESFDFLVQLRLRGQIAAIEAGREPSNYIAMEQLNHMEQGRLRLAFEAVNSFQEFLNQHFQLDFVR